MILIHIFLQGHSLPQFIKLNSLNGLFKTIKYHHDAQRLKLAAIVCLIGKNDNFSLFINLNF